MNEIQFFQKEANLNILRDFVQVFGEISVDETDREKTMLRHSCIVIDSITNSANEWNTWTQFNIRHIGEHFITVIDEQTKNRDFEIDKIEELCTDCYRFLVEYELHVPTNKELSRNLRIVKDFVEGEVFPNNARALGQVRYATTSMVVGIMREYIHHDNLNEIKEFNKTAAQAESFRKTWDNEIKAKQEEVNNLKKGLDELGHGFNFVGLHEGFAKMTTSKNIEKWILNVSLIVMGLFIISPLLFEIWILFGSNGDEGQKATQVVFNINSFYKFIPLATLEIILIYFFRIILMNHKSVKAEILQLKLRMTLCEFIQKYVEYAMKIKKQDSGALEKFETLIFSGIVSDSEKLPSTFDGIDQLIKLAKAVKTK